MNNAAAWERFERWFRADGHWIYRSREHAIDTWKRIGINGLPDFPK